MQIEPTCNYRSRMTEASTGSRSSSGRSPCKRHPLPGF